GNGARPDGGAGAGKRDGEIRGRPGRRAGLHRHRGVGPRHPGLQHHHHQPGRPLRAGPALPAPGAGGARAPAGLRVPAGARRRPDRRDGPEAAPGHRGVHRAGGRAAPGHAGSGDPGDRQPPGGGPARAHRGGGIRSLQQAPGGGRARIARGTGGRAGRPGHLGRRRGAPPRVVRARGEPAPRALQAAGRDRAPRGDRGCARRAGGSVRPTAPAGRGPDGRDRAASGRPSPRGGAGGSGRGPGGPHLHGVDPGDARADAEGHRGQSRRPGTEKGVHGGGTNPPRALARGARRPREAPGIASMSGRRLPLIALLALATAGCSMAIPSWVPLLGNKPKPNAEIAEPPKPAPAPAPPLSSRDHIEESPDVVDRVVCVVNNDAITQYELDEAELYYLAETRERMSDGEARKALRGRLLQNLIENRIQLQQAEREKVTVDDAELAENVADIMKKLKAKDEKEFEEIIKSQGLTVDGVKKRLREQLMVQRVIRRKVALRISVTEQEIDKYLADNREKLE